MNSTKNTTFKKKQLLIKLISLKQFTGNKFYFIMSMHQMSKVIHTIVERQRLSQKPLAPLLNAEEFLRIHFLFDITKYIEIGKEKNEEEKIDVKYDSFDSQLHGDNEPATISDLQSSNDTNAQHTPITSNYSDENGSKIAEQTEMVENTVEDNCNIEVGDNLQYIEDQETETEQESDDEELLNRYKLEVSYWDSSVFH